MGAETKHTPGPWEEKHCSDGYGVFSGVIMVARIDNTVGEFNQEKRNAHLIAAAPGLLEACKRLLPAAEFASLEQSPPGYWDNDINFARAVIAEVERK